MPFLDRADAGRRLAGLLASQLTIERGAGTVVLGLPRGGIPVAYQIARVLDAPLVDHLLLPTTGGIPLLAFRWGIAVYRSTDAGRTWTAEGPLRG